jgi:protein arginine kinase activator
MKCDNCNKTATVHLTEIRNGKKVEKHLCEQCAAQSEGFPVKSHTPINELLTNFVLAHSGLQQKETGSSTCEQCGITWAEFRQSGLLGCQRDYDVFDRDLTPLLQRAHEGGTHHVGKVPTRQGAPAAVDAPGTGALAAAGTGEPTTVAPAAPARKKVDLGKLRKELNRAVEVEDYERAAKLRDQIREAEAE